MRPGEDPAAGPPTSAPIPSAAFLRLGAATALYYVLAQIFQRLVTRLALPPAADAAAEIAIRLLPLDRARQLAILTSLFAIPFAFAALALARFRRAPGAATAGLAFGLLFCGFETAYRAVDLFAGGRWATDFAAATDPALRAALVSRFELWEQGVAALYFPLVAAHGLASAAFAVAVWDRRDAWDRPLAIALGANAVRALLRVLEMHAGVAALAPLNRELYLPVTLVTYGVLAAWLAHAARLARAASPTHSSPPPS